MPLTRKDHWAERHYNDFLLAHAKAPFQWGVMDCALFAADGILAFTGIDIAGDFRGKYTTDLGAMRAIRTVTGGSTTADALTYCSKKYGLEEYTHPLMAKRGDLVLLEDQGRLIAGLVHLSGRHVISVGEDGLLRKPLTTIKRAWRV